MSGSWRRWWAGDGRPVLRALTRRRRVLLLLRFGAWIKTHGPADVVVAAAIPWGR